MEGQGHTASCSAQPRFQISKPTSTILTALLAWRRCKVFKELRLASALRDALGGAKKPKVRNLMGALLIPILLVLGCSEQFSKLL